MNLRQDIRLRHLVVSIGWVWRWKGRTSEQEGKGKGRTRKTDEGRECDPARQTAAESKERNGGEKVKRMRERMGEEQKAGGL